MKNRLKQFLNKKFIAAKCRLANKLAENDGQFSMDSSIYIIIAIVVGGIVLALVISFIQADLGPTIKAKIMDFFN